jgi:hypothetical protein
MPPPLPRCSGWVYSSLNITHPYQPSPVPLPCRPAHRPFRGLLSVHSRCGLHTRAVTYTWPLSEGFRHFVTSMPAPVASGWSGCRAGFAPAGEAPPFHGARGLRPLASSRPNGAIAPETDTPEKRNLCQPIQQARCCHKIVGVESFGEPIVNGHQQLAPFGCGPADAASAQDW